LRKLFFFERYRLNLETSFFFIHLSLPLKARLLPRLLLLLSAATALLSSPRSCSAASPSLLRVPGNGVIRNGALKRDVNGNEMDAHDGNIIQFEAGGPYYMYRYANDSPFFSQLCHSKRKEKEKRRRERSKKHS